MALCCFAANHGYSMGKHQREAATSWAAFTEASGKKIGFFPLIQVTTLPVVFEAVFTKSKEVFEVSVG